MSHRLIDYREKTLSIDGTVVATVRHIPNKGWEWISSIWGRRSTRKTFHTSIDALSAAAKALRFNHNAIIYPDREAS